MRIPCRGRANELIAVSRGIFFAGFGPTVEGSRTFFEIPKTKAKEGRDE
jgi:hypothetical protein